MKWLKRLVEFLKDAGGAYLLLMIMFGVIGAGVLVAVLLIRIPLIQILTINGFLAPYMTIGIIIGIGWLVTRVFRD